MVPDRAQLGGVGLCAVQVVAAQVDVVVFKVAFDVGSCRLYHHLSAHNSTSQRQFMPEWYTHEHAVCQNTARIPSASEPRCP